MQIKFVPFNFIFVKNNALWLAKFAKYGFLKLLTSTKTFIL